MGWQDVPEGASLEIVVGQDGACATRHRKQVSGDGAAELDLGVLPATSWVMVQLRCVKGDMLAVTNPVFLAGEWR